MRAQSQANIGRFDIDADHLKPVSREAFGEFLYNRCRRDSFWRGFVDEVLADCLLYVSADETTGTVSVKPYDVTGRQVGSRVLSVPKSSVSWSAGSAMRMPMRQLALILRNTVSISDSPLVGDITSAQTMEIIAALWPELSVTGGKGRFIPVTAPEWLGDTVGDSIQLNLLREAQLNQLADDPFELYQQPNPIGGLHPPSTLEVLQRKKKANQEVVEEKRKLMREWARELYFHHSLALARASVTMPLSFGWEIGAVYQVNDPDGGELFKGMLVESKHHVALTSKGGEGYTVLSFSHVRVAGFELTI